MATKVTVYILDSDFIDYLKHLGERRNNDDAINLPVSLDKNEFYTIELSIDPKDITEPPFAKGRSTSSADESPVYSSTSSGAPSPITLTPLLFGPWRLPSYLSSAMSSPCCTLPEDELDSVLPFN